ncbi:germ cell nuclear acidic protein-like [Lineus longissimus]|uniref:germ cell nuclear acidic protein-like n=1 Tax=Lineus longissimus TaxID=88925 RepID=UPI00315D944D
MADAGPSDVSSYADTVAADVSLANGDGDDDVQPQSPGDNNDAHAGDHVSLTDDDDDVHDVQPQSPRDDNDAADVSLTDDDGDNDVQPQSPGDNNDAADVSLDNADGDDDVQPLSPGDNDATDVSLDDADNDNYDVQPQSPRDDTDATDVSSDDAEVSSDAQAYDVNSISSGGYSEHEELGDSSGDEGDHDQPLSRSPEHKQDKRRRDDLTLLRLYPDFLLGPDGFLCRVCSAFAPPADRNNKLLKPFISTGSDLGDHLQNCI